MKLTTKALLASLVALSLVSGNVNAEPPKDAPKDATPTKEVQPAAPATKEVAPATKPEGEKKAVKIKVGDKAPEFSLTDTEGKTVKLSDLNKDGNIVVLQWFNPGCPFIVKQYKDTDTMKNIMTAIQGKKVMIAAINSGAPGKEGAGKEASAKAKADWKINFPILIDESGDTGRAYGARNTPLMVVIDAKGNVAYFGAIDDNPSADVAGKKNYVVNAVNELLAGKPVSESETKAYGCSVKYGAPAKTEDKHDHKSEDGKKK